MFVPFEQLDETSRVWIYQSASKLTEQQAEAINVDLYTFLQEWTAHNEMLHTNGKVYYNQFVVIFVDERFSGASGCSIDKSIHYIEHLEKKYDISLSERKKVAFLDDSNPNNGSVIKLSELSHLNTLVESGEINEDTMFFDNLVKTKYDFEKHWLKPFKNSWHKRFI
jgi:hypothetical protein